MNESRLSTIEQIEQIEQFLSARIATQLPDSQVVARKLGTVQRVVVAAPRYLKKAPVLTKPEHLQAHNCLLYTQTAAPTDWPMAATTHGRPVEVSGTLRVNNSVMLRDALVAGQGVTLTPRFVVDDLLASGVLKEVLVGYRPQDLTVFGLIAPRRYVPHKVRVFLDFIEQQMALGAGRRNG